MDLFEVVLSTLYKGQVCNNRWNYITTSTPAAVTRSFGLVAAMGFIQSGGDVAFTDGSLGEAIRIALSLEVTFTSIVCKNIYVLEDFYTTPFNTGTVGAVATLPVLSPMSAFGLHSNQTTRKVRAASKRFVGVSAGLTEDGGIISSVGLGLLDTIAGLMSTNLSYDDEGSILQYQPVVVHKQKIVDPDTGKVKYQYFPTIDEQVPDNVATSVIWSSMNTVRSQTSRQYGHGS